MEAQLFPARSLSRREAEVVAWLEADRRATVTIDEVAEALNWERPLIRSVLARLANKGWLTRVARGRYETLLAETGGVAVPNAWAALSLWGQPYYVAFQSAAYEQGFTPDRPGVVQVACCVGAVRPLAWADIPVTLIPQRGFSRVGATEEKLHGFTVWIASPERLLVDGAARPARIGGLNGLLRVLDRSREQIDWPHLADVAAHVPNGRPALRRLAYLLSILQDDVPKTLDDAAVARPGEASLFLADQRLHDNGGERNARYGVVANVEKHVLLEELEH